MSKKNNNNQHLKQRIREQQQEINKLGNMNSYLCSVIDSQRLQMYTQFADVMCNVYSCAMEGSITEEQAGILMYSIVRDWDFTCE